LRICAALAAVLTIPIFSAETPTHFEQANRLYEQGKVDEAISLYNSMIKAGHNSPGVYFNLGNAYFKHGQLGYALLNYRRAQKLAPRDPDLQANLRFARDRVSGSISVRPPAWQRLFSYVTLNEPALGAAMLFWIWAILFCASRLRPMSKRQFRTPLLFVGILCLVALVALALAWISHTERTAIVIAKQATVHLGPFPESQAAFTASDGTELRFLAQREGWFQVKDRSSRSGWIAATNAVLDQPFWPRKSGFATNNAD
jgi:pentatricopeptide repeat protein